MIYTPANVLQRKFCEQKSESLDLFLFLNLDRDSHARAHLRMKARHSRPRYAWQEASPSLDEGDSSPKKTEEKPSENVDPQKKSR